MEAVAAIAEKFDFKVLAEGVEDVETLALLKQFKCDIYQGYYSHRRMPMHEFEKLL